MTEQQADYEPEAELSPEEKARADAIDQVFASDSFRAVADAQLTLFRRSMDRMHALYPALDETDVAFVAGQLVGWIGGLQLLPAEAFAGIVDGHREGAQQADEMIRTGKADEVEAMVQSRAAGGGKH